MQQYGKTVQKFLTLIISQNKAINWLTTNANWPQISAHAYRILIVAGSSCRKTNALLNLISHQPDTDKIHLYAKDPYNVKGQLLVNKREGAGTKHFNDSEALIEYSSDMDDVYKNIEEYNWGKKQKILFIFHDMIADVLNNTKLSPLVAEWFIKKIFISVVFIIQCCFTVTKRIVG